MRNLIFISLTFVASLVCLPAYAQDCSPPKIVANANSANMFSPEQEMVIGELTFQNIALDTRRISDEKLLAFIRTIGERLIRHLPPTGLKFQFHIVDNGETNAYNIPGGHVLITRKLIAFSNNEDELAGVIAHELGHATVHHGAVDISEAMRKVLNINSVGDRKDIFEKYNLLIENARTKKSGGRQNHDDGKQLEADKIGLFALVAAGYQAEAFSSFFDRLTENEGKTGNWFSDLFGNTKPESKRMREMIRLTNDLPGACRDSRSAAPSADFLDWQASVVSYRDTARKEFLPGLIWKRELNPKLSSDINHLLFSDDGHYMLAQNDFSISVLEREGGKFLFQIPIDGADNAAFSPDGSQIIFITEDLRFERWSIPEKRPLEIRELVLRRDCFESALSPDGKFLACIDTSTKIAILETKTGKKVFEKKDFYPLSGFELITWLARARGDDKDTTNFFRIQFSPDSRSVIFSRSDRFRFRIKIDLLTVDESENSALALDLTTLKPINLGGDIKKLSANPFIFLDSERILGIPSAQKIDSAGIFSFPDGKRLKQFRLWCRTIKRTANPEYVIIKPMAGGGIGFFNLRTGEIASGLRKLDATIWKNIAANEATSGRITFQEVTENKSEKKFDNKGLLSVEIPTSTFGNLRSAEISDNFSWLIASTKTRGALWNLETGERKLFLRGFRGGVVGADGVAVSEFPRWDDTPHSLALLNPSTANVNVFRELPNKGSRQFGRFILSRTNLKVDPKKQEKEDAERKKRDSQYILDENDFDDSTLNGEVKFELTDFVTNTVVLTREFKNAAPRFSFDTYSGRLIFYWDLGSDLGKDRLKDFPNLKQSVNALGDKTDDYLVEIYDAYAKKDLGAFLLETGKGSFDVRRGVSEGESIMFRDNENRLLIYSIKTGALQHRFFGRQGVLHPNLRIAAIESFPGVVNLFDLGSGVRLNGVEVNGDVEFMRFDLSGKKLFVLSENQIAYAFDLTKMPRSAK